MRLDCDPPSENEAALPGVPPPEEFRRTEGPHPSPQPGGADGWCWAGGLALGALFVALRWNNLTVPLVRDEGEYAYAAQLLQHGLVPYTHCFLQKPPMVAYSYALAQLLAPHWFWAPRLLATIFMALTTVLVGRIASKAFGKDTAFPAMALFIPMVMLPCLDQFTANTEMFLLLPLVGAVALYALSPRPASRRLWFLGGVLGAIACAYKYTALPIVAWVYCVWSIEQWRGDPGVRSLGARWLAMGLGATLALSAVLGVFLAHDAGRHLWECTVAFNRFYATSSSFCWEALRWRLGSFLSHWWILFLLPWALVRRAPPRPWVWIGGLLVAGLTTARSWYGHYYLVLMPFWALLAGAGLQRAAAWLATRRAWPEAWLRRCLTIAAVAVVCWANLPWMLLTPNHFLAAKTGRSGPFLESEEVARRVVQLTSAQDPVLVAGSEPQILRYAERFSPTRFVIAYPFMTATPLAEGYQREVIHDLQTTPPKVVVLVHFDKSWATEAASPMLYPKFLMTLLADRYECVGGLVDGGPAGRWLEPLPEADFGRSSLILYRRCR